MEATGRTNGENSSSIPVINVQLTSTAVRNMVFSATEKKEMTSHLYPDPTIAFELGGLKLVEDLYHKYCKVSVTISSFCKTIEMV